MPNKIAVVVPNWNGAEFISECLSSMQNQTIEAKVVVVDNGSSDESVNIVRTKFPNVHLIENNENLGFAGGVNKGIEYAIKNGVDFVALFNNDAVADKKWLSCLVKIISQDDDIGIVTGKLMLADKVHLDSTGDFYSIWGIPFPRGRNQIDKNQYEKAEEVFAASGGASLYRTKMLREIGLFDEAFFAYYEDVDISFRARLAGWKITYEPSAVAYHHVGATSSKLGSFTRYHSIKNFLLLYTKNMPGYLYWKYLPLFWFQTFRFGVSSAVKGGFLAYLKALVVFIYLSPSALLNRYRIQRTRKISASKIDELLLHERPPKIPSIIE